MSSTELCFYSAQCTLYWDHSFRGLEGIYNAILSLCSLTFVKQKLSPTLRKNCGMRIFIGSPPVVYKYIWVVAEADFKHIQKIAFGGSLKHCRAGELLWNLELSFWIKCSYLLYLSSQISCQLLLAGGESDTEHTPCELCVISPVGHEWSEVRSSTVILQVHHSDPATGLPTGKAAGLLFDERQKFTSVANLLAWPPASPSMDHRQVFARTKWSQRRFSSSFP